MLQMIDTHCHLYLPEFESDAEEVINRAISAGVNRFYFPGIDMECHKLMTKLEQEYPGFCFAMIGLHPCSVKENYHEELKYIKKQLSLRKFAGIGETGLDFFWDTTFKKQQYESLNTHIELALEFGLPLILHTRNATQETIDVIKNFEGRGLRGIFHCFGGTRHEADQIIDTGFYLGIGGIITYKNAGLAEVLQDVDLKHLVLETDSPYLAPVPFRGKRNESSYLKFIAEKLATIKNVSLEEVESVTTFNAENIFGS